MDTLQGEKDNIQVEKDNIQAEKSGIQTERDNIKAERDNLQREKVNLNTRIATLSQEKSKLQSDYNDLKTKNTELNQEQRKLNEEMAIAMEKINEHKETIHSLTSTAGSQETEKQADRIMAILNNETDVIAPHLKSNGMEWILAKNIDTFSQMKEALDDKDLKKKMKKVNGVVIMLGAKDIADGMSGLHAASILTDIVDIILKITTNNVFICEMPPTRVNLAQYAIYNRKIRDMSAKNRVIVIDTNKAFDTLPKSKSVIENSYMMTPEGGLVLGKAISEQVIITDKHSDISTESGTTSEESDQENVPPIVYKMEIPKNCFGYIYGKGGETKKRLQEEYKVEMEKGTWTNSKGEERQGMQIHGSEEAIGRARLALRKLIRDKQDADRRSTPCRFHLDGDCWKGENCMYKHDIRAKKPKLFMSPEKKPRKPKMK